MDIGGRGGAKKFIDRFGVGEGGGGGGGFANEVFLHHPFF